MDRKKFLKNGILGLGGIVSVSTFWSSCKDKEPVIDENTCAVSPTETGGPFPIKTPAQLVRENIVGNRSGVPLLINITVQNVNNNCQPIEGVLVDIWHCDAKGNYSQYNGQQEGNFTNENFLRGRQATNANGVASFISIYPGWYPGRAPHLHLEILSSSGNSLLITQTAFPENISNTVYASTGYNGNFDTPNASDGEFGNSLNRNMATSVTGNVTDGYTLNEVIKVAV